MADFRSAGRLDPRRALDLTEDTSILTAIANDVGVEEIFQRQVIAYGARGRRGAGAFSTSGSSENIIAALAEARARGLVTIAMVGYDGGQSRRRGARRPRDRHPLPAHPADPGGAGERLPRAARAAGAQRVSEPAAQSGRRAGQQRGRGCARGAARRDRSDGDAASWSSSSAPKGAGGSGAPKHASRGRSRASASGPSSTGSRAELGLAGWVLNDERGVLLEAEGEPGAARAVRRRLRAEAPPLAAVEDVVSSEAPIRPARGGFTDRRLAAPGGEPRGAGLARHGDLRRLPRRAPRSRRPPPPLPVHQLHQLRPAVHDRPRRPLRPAADDDGRLRDVRCVPGRVRGSRATAASTPSRTPARPAARGCA